LEAISPKLQGREDDISFVKNVVARQEFVALLKVRHAVCMCGADVNGVHLNLSFYSSANDWQYSHVSSSPPHQLHQEVTCGPVKAHRPVTLNALEVAHTVS